VRWIGPALRDEVARAPRLLPVEQRLEHPVSGSAESEIYAIHAACRRRANRMLARSAWQRRAGGVWWTALPAKVVLQGDTRRRTRLGSNIDRRVMAIGNSSPPTSTPGLGAKRQPC
jgi:hypothetical protein